jgi:hypothetical protein
MTILISKSIFLLQSNIGAEHFPGIEITAMGSV